MCLRNLTILVSFYGKFPMIWPYFKQNRHFAGHVHFQLAGKRKKNVHVQWMTFLPFKKYGQKMRILTS